MGDWQTDRVRAVESGDASDVARAMNEVLAAERAAAAAIEACRADVAEQLAAARLAARACIERAEATAQAIHGRTETVAAARAAALTEAATTTPAVARPLAAVVDEVAAWLVGSDDA
jgi:regulator of protease activity HflC (stomatin/prohibitin superfamily)